MSQSEEKTYPPLPKVPVHVGIIMDGNGRWAQARGLPRIAGHQAGTENLRRILRATVEFGIRILTIYAFSTENWERPREEVEGLMNIMERMIDQELPELHREGVQIRHIGRMERVPERLQEKIRYALDLTRNNQRLILNVAFNYGGRAEIVDAVRRIIQDGISAEQVDEALIARYLYTAGLPDPDLIIRTSGEMRVSNFLIWQGAYAEYYVTPVYWPDFDKDEYYKALTEYARRERRFGRVPG
ncbi:MAG: isoprenyl transferase [Anaerolineae bacterium]|nr:isoprenyl transferase [Anaerolineae bacterium]MCX8067921.1 isoprenyl transferase [Anaerolineae bacterium]MDW7992374.1 isoprenyl transferase [Anaerolineae bacterium]